MLVCLGRGGLVCAFVDLAFLLLLWVFKSFVPFWPAGAREGLFSSPDISMKILYMWTMGQLDFHLARTIDGLFQVGSFSFYFRHLIYEDPVQVNQGPDSELPRPVDDFHLARTIEGLFQVGSFSLSLSLFSSPDLCIRYDIVVIRISAVKAYVTVSRCSFDDNPPFPCS